MGKRYALFITTAVVILLGHQLLMNFLGLNPANQNVAEQPAGQGTDAEKAAPAAKADDAPRAPASNAEIAAAPQAEVGDEPAAEPKWATLGSVDPASPYRMLPTFTSAGAAIERIELSGRRFHELEDHTGYLGHLSETDGPGGAIVNSVGAGTPAQTAGIQPGDIIVSVGEQAVTQASDLVAVLAETKPKDSVEVGLRRNGQNLTVTATLTRHPLDIIRPEHQLEPLKVSRPGQQDPLSFLMTITQVGDERIPSDQLELPGVDLLNGHWNMDEIVPGSDQVTFRRKVPKYGLEVVKRFQLARTPDEEIENESFKSYHLSMEIEIHNLRAEPQKVAYQLHGPTGLPTEGWWYATRINAGLRDIVSQFPGISPTSMITQDVLSYEAGLQGIPQSPVFMGVDAQYFAAVLLPQNAEGQNWFQQWEPRVVGERPDSSHSKLANVSFRLASQTLELPPAGGEPIKHQFVIFAGPKRPALLANYGPPEAPLSAIVDYGWFWWVAGPMLSVLHFFYGIVGNYGIAIIMLTIVVRGCLFPLSRRQAQSAQVMQSKMAEMGPEMKKINEKYKGNAEQRGRAMQELWKKHDYHPAAALGGCLLMFLQLPIFIGLYRSLMVDVELRQAPLLSESIRWCSNLGAPDMLFYWGNWLPFLTDEAGWLGPYFNVLPLVTVGLFLWQQKMFMPPPADEQAAMQQKIMQYMMVVIAFMFYKVASGLCIYFIASSLWGIAERKLLPKPEPKPGSQAPGTSPAAKVTAVSSSASSSNKSRNKKYKGKR